MVLIFGTLYNVEKPLRMLVAHVQVTGAARDHHARHHGPLVTCFPNNFYGEENAFLRFLDVFLMLR